MKLIALFVTAGCYLMTTVGASALSSAVLSTYPCQYGSGNSSSCTDEHAVCGDGNLCQCSDGFVGDGGSCIEDGCRNATCDSNATCAVFFWYDARLELRASFRCVCNDDWIGDGVTCRPSPCAPGRHNCHPLAVCMIDLNDVEFSCFCKEGLIGNGTSCYPDICKTNDSLCTTPSEMCRSTGVDSFDCRCAQEYYRQDGVCRLDPCAPGRHNCSQNALCSAHLDGSSSCVCGENYYQSSPTECKPHPCFLLTDTCSIDAVCQPLSLENGRLTPEFTCQCKDSYYGDGFTCSPDPCIHGLHNCDRNATCISESAGKFHCSCPETYYVDGGVCKLHPCFRPSKPCDVNAWCTPNPAEDDSYSCMCVYPFEGNGTFCKLIGNATCADDQFTCPKTGRCIPYLWTLDGIKDCSEGEDENESFVDECLAGKHRCHALAVCINVPSGSYECRCREPFFGDGFDCDRQPPTTTSTASETRFTSSTSTSTSQMTTVSVNCDSSGQVIRCKSTPTVCISPLNILNGVADCPNSDDEEADAIAAIEECAQQIEGQACDTRANCSLLKNGLCYCVVGNNSNPAHLCRPMTNIAAPVSSFSAQWRSAQGEQNDRIFDPSYVSSA